MENIDYKFIFDKFHLFKIQNHIPNLDLFRTAKFGIRLWIYSPQKTITFYEIINNTDSISSYVLFNKKGKLYKHVVKKDKEKWTLFFKILKNNNIFNLPSEPRLKWDLFGYVNGKKRRTYILHGWMFYFETINNKKYNSFYYYNPQDHNWKEAKNVDNILSEFRKLKKSERIDDE